MVFTYEIFGKNYTYLYLPLWKGMPKEEKEFLQINAGLDEWIPYIDQHIKEDLSLEEIAAHFNYSKRHFCRIFKNYFTYSAAEYIRKERLYLAARDIKNTEDDADRFKIILQYRFEDYESFRKSFYEEFHTDPENYYEVSFHLPNLTQYYMKHKNQITIHYVEIQELNMIGRTIQARNAADDVQDNLDIPDLAAYWMRHDSDEIKLTKYACNCEGEENKLALWFTDPKTGNSEYILGPVTALITEIPEGFKVITLSEGKYAVIESQKENDSQAMTEMYRMLSRCTYGWIREQRYRVDLNRLTFVRYFGRKLHFYVPVYE